MGLLYLDIDAHHPWQTDQQRARAILEQVFPFGYFRPSRRGENGYLKIRYISIAEFNETADRLQAILKNLLLHLGILCDVEVKGTITHNGKSGRLAKLPFNTTNRREDSWKYEELAKFKACPVVNVRRVENIIGQLDDRFDEEKVQRFAEYKKSLLDQEQGKRLKNQPVTKPDRKVEQAVPAKTEAKPSEADQTTKTPTPPATVRVALPEMPSDDAFARNQKDIKPFVRAFYREHHRFPTTEETLDWIKDNGRYSGEWEDREGKRAKRVGKILAYTKQNFDPKMLSAAMRFQPGWLGLADELTMC